MLVICEMPVSQTIQNTAKLERGVASPRPLLSQLTVSFQRLRITSFAPWRYLAITSRAFGADNKLRLGHGSRRWTLLTHAAIEEHLYFNTPILRTSRWRRVVCYGFRLSVTH